MCGAGDALRVLLLLSWLDGAAWQLYSTAVHAGPHAWGAYSAAQHHPVLHCTAATKLFAASSRSQRTSRPACGSPMLQSRPGQARPHACAHAGAGTRDNSGSAMHRPLPAMGCKAWTITRRSIQTAWQRIRIELLSGHAHACVQPGSGCTRNCDPFTEAATTIARSNMGAPAWGLSTERV